LELTKFIFITGLKVLVLLFLSLLAVKAVGGLRRTDAWSRRVVPIQWGLYAVILTLAALGAMTIGYDVAAEVYVRAGNRELKAHNLGRAYINARRAVELRPASLRYWQVLSGIKFAQKQYVSVTDDAPALQSLADGDLSEADAYRLAVSHYLLGEYAQVHPLTQRLMRDNRFYAAPYVLEGYTFLAEGELNKSTHIFLEVLRMFPTQQSAVEGLAHAQYLGGNRSACLSVLDQTQKYQFPPEARRRFEALKEFYGLE